MSMDYELFRGKNLSDLFEDIYRNQQTKKTSISQLIHEIRTKATTPKDMALLYPVIKDLVDTSVKNDDALIKMAAIVQRMINSENKSEGDSGFLTESEKQELLDIAKKQAEEAAKRLNNDISNAELGVKEIEEKMKKFNESES